MKNKFFMKKAAAGLLTLTLIISMAYVFPGKVIGVQAAGTSYAEAIAIDAYREGETTAPKPLDEAHRDWIFAGWYEDADCSQAVVDKASAAGTKYARFVPVDVLSVKCQVTEGTVSDTDSCRLRVVSTVDNLNYRKVGFEFKIGEREAFEHDTTKVFKKIVAGVGHDAFSHLPQEFHESSNYFSTVTITNIPKTGFQTGIRIIPYWVTVDGTKVYGAGRYARVEDSYENIVNVPVRLYSDKEVAAGYLEVSYDSSKFTYVSSDVGTVFEEMEARDDSARSSIRCVGNAADIGKNKKADGMYINLRFKVVDMKTLGEEEAFRVSEERFCDTNEKFVYEDDSAAKFDVLDAVHKNMN